MDVIRTLAQERHFYTAELTLRDYGTVLLIGDSAAVERLSRLVAEHAEHELTQLDATRAVPAKDEPPADLTPSAA